MSKIPTYCNSHNDVALVYFELDSNLTTIILEETDDIQLAFLCIYLIIQYNISYSLTLKSFSFYLLQILLTQLLFIINSYHVNTFLIQSFIFDSVYVPSILLISSSFVNFSSWS
jgi:hypothetical protein